MQVQTYVRQQIMGYSEGISVQKQSYVSCIVCAEKNIKQMSSMQMQADAYNKFESELMEMNSRFARIGFYDGLGEGIQNSQECLPRSGKSISGSGKEKVGSK